MINIPSFYAEKLSYGPIVKGAIVQTRIPPLTLSMDFGEIMTYAAAALKKRVSELVVVVPERPRNQAYIDVVRSQGAALRLIVDGDIAAAVAPAMPDSGVDLFIGIGGSPEGILTAAALKALGGEIYLRMWPHNDEERQDLLKTVTEKDLQRIYSTSDLIVGESALFCATGISDSALLPGVKFVGSTATTHSILMRARSQTVRYIRAVHNLGSKTIHLSSIKSEAKV
jgi:fructose-1,6-bisphosphatase II